MNEQPSSEQGDSEKRIVTLGLTMHEADELWDLLGRRPHWEDWSRDLWERIAAAMDNARKACL